MHWKLSCFDVSPQRIRCRRYLCYLRSYDLLLAPKLGVSFSRAKFTPKNYAHSIIIIKWLVINITPHPSPTFTHIHFNSTPFSFLILFAITFNNIDLSIGERLFTIKDKTELKINKFFNIQVEQRKKYAIKDYHLCPLGQGKHSWTPVPLYVPLGQSLGVSDTEKHDFPAGHSLHEICPVSFWYVPFMQRMGVANPSVGQ